MGDRNITCSYDNERDIFTVYLPGNELSRILATKMVKLSPNKSPFRKSNRSSLGSAWTQADIQELYDLRQAKKSWSQIGKSIKRSGGAAQQQWIRMQRENHPLLRNDHESEDQESERPELGQLQNGQLQNEQFQNEQFHNGQLQNEQFQNEQFHNEQLQNGQHEEDQENEVQEKEEKSTAIEEESKDEGAADERGRRCCKCHDYEASNVSDMATCSVCHNAYHQFCHQPQIPLEFFSTTDKHWSCANCTESESKIGTAFAERLHTAVSEGTMAKRGKKRKRRTSSVAASQDGAEPENISVAEEVKTLNERVQELQEDNAAMQQRIDDVVASQERKEAELNSLKETVKGLKANAAEKTPSSPINGWFSKAKRFPGFGGA